MEHGTSFPYSHIASPQSFNHLEHGTWNMKLLFPFHMSLVTSHSTTWNMELFTIVTSHFIFIFAISTTLVPVGKYLMGLRWRSFAMSVSFSRHP
jgi:hypothetical protein